MKISLFLVSVLFLLTSCSLTKIKSGQQYLGSSMDVLQDNQSIFATINDNKLKIKIVAGKENCSGSFEYKDSDKSYLGFTTASNNYIGMFEATKGPACEKAIGNKGNKKIQVQVVRLGGVLGSSMMASTGIRICGDAEGMCMAKNTFKVNLQ